MDQAEISMLYPSVMIRRLFLPILLLLAVPIAAQSTVADLQGRLIHKPLYLRGQWFKDKLKFDSAGTLIGTSTIFPYTLSGIEIESLKLSGKGLKLEGYRVGLIFPKGITRSELWTGLGPNRSPEYMQVEIQAPSNGDYTAALDKIFTSDLADFVPNLPSYWQDYGRRTFYPPSSSGVVSSAQPSKANATSSTNARPKVSKVGGSVIPPKVLSMVEPSFTDQAKFVKVSGNVLVYLQVDTEGRPTRIRILKPLGLGLDEMAVVAVSRYKFKPAEQNGVPVAVEMNVEVNFQIF